MAGEKVIPGDREVHEKLARGMATRMGGVPELAMDPIIERCRHCPHPQSCAAWQLDQAPEVEATPGYCLNSDRFLDFVAE